MKKARELTDAQVVELAKLGMSEIINFDFVFSVIQGQNNIDYKYRIVREEFDKDMIVIRAYLDGFADKTYLQIWEADDLSDIEVDVIHEQEDYNLANIIKIVKKLMEWGFC